MVDDAPLSCLVRFFNRNFERFLLLLEVMQGIDHLLVESMLYLPLVAQLHSYAVDGLGSFILQPGRQGTHLVRFYLSK